jgi:hypothetical protein
MASINDLKTSKFLKKEDVGDGTVVTITEVAKLNVAAEGAPHEEKWCLIFREFDKPMVLNSTNGQSIAAIVGTGENIENTWPGKRVELFNDPNVSYAGKLMGGIRVRAPRGPAMAGLDRTATMAAIFSLAKEMWPQAKTTKELKQLVAGELGIQVTSFAEAGQGTLNEVYNAMKNRLNGAEAEDVPPRGSDDDLPF